MSRSAMGPSFTSFTADRAGGTRTPRRLGVRDALLRVAQGGGALNPEVVQALVRGQNGPRALQNLSNREREVLALVAQGQSNVAVGRALALSDRTVEAHLRSIFTKLDLYDD